MSVSGMVEIPTLQAKRRSVMPAKAGIQGGEGVTNTENLDSRFRGKDGREVDFESIHSEPLA
jgi:hypothetical protein